MSLVHARQESLGGYLLSLVDIISVYKQRSLNAKAGPQMKPARALRHARQGLVKPLPLRGGFVCLQCQYRAAKASTTFAEFASGHAKRNISTSSGVAASTMPYTERLRKRIWGTTEPPGEENPYGDNSVIDRVNAQRDAQSATQDAERAKSLGSGYETVQGDYVPSTTWDGLEHIGGATGWWEDAWDQENQFQGFLAPTKMYSKEELSAAIHQALVEIYTLSEADRPLADASNVTLGVFGDLGAVSFSNSEEGLFKIVFPDETLRELVLNATLPVPSTQTAPVVEGHADAEVNPTPDVWDKVPVETAAGDIMVEEEPLTDSEVVVLAEPSDNTWMNIPLSDPTKKFNILKRVMQLTGRRVADHEIDGIKSAKALLRYLVKKPKPKKLADSLLVNDNLVSLPNVQVMERRYTPIDREKEVGRWKVIERELERRRLPVTGSLL